MGSGTVKMLAQRKHEINAGVSCEYHHSYFHWKAGVGRVRLTQEGRSRGECGVSGISRLRMWDPGILHSGQLRAWQGKMFLVGMNCVIFSLARRRMSVGAGCTPCSLCKVQHIRRLRDLLATVKNSAKGKVLCPDRTVGGSRNSGMDKEASA